MPTLQAGTGLRGKRQQRHLARNREAVFFHESHRPLQFILNALTRRLRRRPQFKIDNSVVIANAIDMMDVLMRRKRPSEILLHNKPVLYVPYTVDRD